MTSNKYDIEVYPQLMRLLRLRKWTQAYLSEKTGIPQGTISRFDKNTQFNIEHLYKIAYALDLESIDQLFEVRLRNI